MPRRALGVVGSGSMGNPWDIELPVRPAHAFEIPHLVQEVFLLERPLLSEVPVGSDAADRVGESPHHAGRPDLPGTISSPLPV
jgi:hypothetical protein